ncbi:MAG: 50S ribosomal protein L30 [Nanoarchaeota archaeon]|nr:50S ribosomal protein L30 [Nanoarchaeota archaeon]|tara:strand:+ start:1200 stop:1478 length:279 start_codon:yes stop_codon:yes gene_type:complete
MAKEQTTPELVELKEALNKGKIVVGFDSVMKKLRSKAVKKVFLASNCPEHLSTDIEHYGKLSDIAVTWLDLNNEDLGVFCKKQFFISVIGIE